MILHKLGTMTGAETTLIAAWTIVPLILIAECFSWHAVLTRNYLLNGIENSLWAVAFFIAGITGFLAFLMTVDVPMYLALAHGCGRRRRVLDAA